MATVSGNTGGIPMIEKQVLKYLEALRSRQSMPLRVTLWDGSTVALGDEPRVDLRLKDAASARYFLRPSMSTLGEAFVEGHIDVDGDIRDIVSVAEHLSRAGDEEHGRGRLPSWLARHTRKSDRRAIEYHYDVSNEFYSATPAQTSPLATSPAPARTMAPTTPARAGAGTASTPAPKPPPTTRSPVPPQAPSRRPVASKS